MHGIEHRVSERWTFRPLCSPPSAFFPLAGSTLPGPPQPFPSLLYGTRRSGRPFARLQRLPLSRTPFQGHCSRPDPSLSRSVASRPVRLAALQPVPVSTRFRPFPCFSPLPFGFLALTALPPAPTPLRDFYLPRDQSVRLTSGRLARLPGSARFPLTPRSHRLLLVSGSGSKFQTRYVTGGLLFLQPLGTFLTMLPCHRSVNGIS